MYVSNSKSNGWRLCFGKRNVYVESFCEGMGLVSKSLMSIARHPP